MATRYDAASCRQFVEKRDYKICFCIVKVIFQTSLLRLISVARRLEIIFKIRGKSRKKILLITKKRISYLTFLDWGKLDHLDCMSILICISVINAFLYL